jgi:hypothetical protein
VLARRALLITNVLALAGALLGLVATGQGAVTGAEIGLIFCCLAFSSGSVFALLFLRKVPLEPVAIVSTAYFGIHLCVGAIVSATGPAQHFNLFIYLVWFFPLLAFDRLVNGPQTGGLLGKSLLLAPVLIVAVLFPRLSALFEPSQLFALAAYLLSYICSGLMLNTVAHYREDYIVERERAESFRTKSQVLESISDCFISLDTGLNLVYLNDAACEEFGVERAAALQTSIVDAAPGFFRRRCFRVCRRRPCALAQACSKHPTEGTT